VKHKSYSITIVAHSWGADTAMRVVSRGHRVAHLITVDPVRKFIGSADLADVAKYSDQWTNYHATERGGSGGGKVAASVGGRYGDLPNGFATSHIRVPTDHVQVCLDYCYP